MNSFDANETAKRIPSAEVIFKMAKYFDVSADYILGIKEDKKPLQSQRLFNYYSA